MRRYRYKEHRINACPVFGHQKDAAVCVAGKYPECARCQIRARDLAIQGPRTWYLKETDTKPTWADEWVEIAEDGTHSIVTRPQPKAEPVKKTYSFWDGFQPSQPSTYRYTPSAKGAVVVPATRKRPVTRTPKTTLGEVATDQTLTRKYRELKGKQR